MPGSNAFVSTYSSPHCPCFIALIFFISIMLHPPVAVLWRRYRMTKLFANAMCIVLRYDRRSESKRKNTYFGQTVPISSCKPNSTRCVHSEHGLSSEEKIVLTVKNIIIQRPKHRRLRIVIGQGSKIVHVPPVQAFGRIPACSVRPVVACFDFRIFGPQLLFKSQFIIILCKLSRLEQTANLRQTITRYCLLRIPSIG